MYVYTYIVRYCYFVDMTDTFSTSFSDCHLSSSRIMEPKMRETEGDGEDNSGRIASFPSEWKVLWLLEPQCLSSIVEVNLFRERILSSCLQELLYFWHFQRLEIRFFVASCDQVNCFFYPTRSNNKWNADRDASQCCHTNLYGTGTSFLDVLCKTLISF